MTFFVFHDFYLITSKTGTLDYNPHLKALCSNISFLVAKSSPGDTVLYVGASISSYILVLAKMFPKLQFKLFDHNTSAFLKNAKESGSVPSNIHHYQEIFSDQVLYFQVTSNMKKQGFAQLCVFMYASNKKSLG